MFRHEEEDHLKFIVSRSHAGHVKEQVHNLLIFYHYKQNISKTFKSKGSVKVKDVAFQNKRTCIWFMRDVQTNKVYPTGQRKKVDMSTYIQYFSD